MIYRLIKKLEDITLSLLIIIFLGPIFIFVIILVFFFNGRPIFYVSKRMIKWNKSISIFKIRTMVKDAKDPKYDLEGKYMEKGFLDIPLDSEVYTPLGRILEKTQFVELPQVFNILLGSISFVGNRPLPEKNVMILKQNFPEKWKMRFESPCGITGITQVVGKFNLTPEKRLELESLYSEVYNKGNILKADAYIFFSTIILLVFQNTLAFRSYDSAKKMLSSCLNK